MQMLHEVIINKRNLLKEGHVENDALEENERDLLTLMIESENRSEVILTGEELKANLCLFFFAGHDTTSSALFFTLYHFTKHPVSSASFATLCTFNLTCFSTRKFNKEQEKKPLPF